MATRMEKHEEYVTQLTELERSFRQKLQNKDKNAYKEFINDLKNLSYTVFKKMVTAEPQDVFNSVLDPSLRHVLATPEDEVAVVDIENPVFRVPKEELLSSNLDAEQKRCLRSIFEEAETITECQTRLAGYIREASRILPNDIFLDVLRSSAMPPLTVTTRQEQRSFPLSDEALFRTHHLPDPDKLNLANEETKLLAALTSYEVRKLALPRSQLSQMDTAQRYHVSPSSFKRILTGYVQEGGTHYAKQKRPSTETQEEQPKKAK